MISSQITEKVRNPGIGSIAILAAMLSASLGSWGVAHTGHGHAGWSDLLNPEHIFSLMGILGSVLGAWLSKSPFKG